MIPVTRYAYNKVDGSRLTAGRAVQLKPCCCRKSSDTIHMQRATGPTQTPCAARESSGGTRQDPPVRPYKAGLYATPHESRIHDLVTAIYTIRQSAITIHFLSPSVPHLLSSPATCTSGLAIVTLYPLRRVSPINAISYNPSWACCAATLLSLRRSAPRKSPSAVSKRVVVCQKRLRAMLLCTNLDMRFDCLANAASQAPCCLLGGGGISRAVTGGMGYLGQRLRA